MVQYSDIEAPYKNLMGNQVYEPGEANALTGIQCSDQ
jgi:hypothetical protein